MLPDDAQIVLSQLERAARLVFEIADTPDDGVNMAIGLSIAISLQRIAEGIERLPDAVL